MTIFILNDNLDRAKIFDYFTDDFAVSDDIRNNCKDYIIVKTMTIINNKCKL